MNQNDAFRYLHIGVPDDIARLQGVGDFHEAIRRMDEKLAGELPMAMRQSLIAHREILRRLPLDYPYTRETAVAYAASILPGFNGAELDELERAGRIDWIQYNGAPHYSSSFLDTLCKTDPVFAARAGSAWGGGVDAKHIGSVRQEIIERLQDAGTLTLTFGVRETLRLRDDLFRPGTRVRAYLPLPCASEGQSDITVSAPGSSSISSSSAAQPVAFFEQTLSENRNFTAEYRLRREARYVDLAALTPSADQPYFDLEEQLPHIAFTPYLRILAAELTEGLTNPLDKARMFYDYVTTNVRYSYMRSYFCLESISDGCARNLVGDCGVQVLMFVTLCRCVGIPAVFHGGWRAGLCEYDGSGDWKPGLRACMCHDWAQFYIAPAGWLFADPSYGGAAWRAGDETAWNFNFGNADPLRVVTNTGYQAGFDAPESFFRIDPYDSQCGEMETEERGLQDGEFDSTQEITEFSVQ